MSRIEAIDTETVDGKAVIIASSKDVRTVENFGQILVFLLQNPADFYFAYNLTYDMQAICKHLSPRVLQELYIKRKIYLKEYACLLEYIPEKWFRIRTPDRCFDFYDLAQFYNMHLEDAGQTFLGEGKHELPKGWIQDLAPILRDRRKKSKVMCYCRQDALLTRRLGEILDETFKKVNFDIGNKYFSFGFVAKKLLGSLPPVPTLEREVEVFLEKCFFGGRIECLIRGGRLGPVFSYDFTSAYPAEIAKLPSLKNCILRKESFRRGDYSFVKIKAWTKKGVLLGPFPVRRKGQSIAYPALRGTEIYTTGVELDAAKPLLERYEVLESVNLWITDPEKPFEVKVKEIFQQRKAGGEMENYCFKIVLNSLYGIFREKKYAYRRLNYRQERALAVSDYNHILRGDIAQKIRPHWNFYECDCDRCKAFRRIQRKLPVRHEVGVIVDTTEGAYTMDRTRKGAFYCVIYACIVTSGLRAKVLEKAIEAGENLVIIATDGLYTRKEISYEGEGLGELAYKGECGKFLSVGSGVYEYFDKAKKKWKTRFRGYRASFKLHDVLKTDGEDIKIPSMQNVTLGLCVKQPGLWKWGDFNKLLEYRKSLHVNFDRRRKWEREAESGKDLLTSMIRSEPL